VTAKWPPRPHRVLMCLCTLGITTEPVTASTLCILSLLLQLQQCCLAILTIAAGYTAADISAVTFTCCAAQGDRAVTTLCCSCSCSAV
jgi:hypothetical protein